MFFMKKVLSLRHNKNITTMTTTNNDIQVLNKEIMIVDFIKGRSGSFRAVVKVKSGFLTIVTRANWENIYDVFSSFKKGALQTIEFQPNGVDHSLVVFAMKGKKCVVMDRTLAEMVTVGDINSTWSSTNLYSREQYNMVKATSWASKVFVVNE